MFTLQKHLFINQLKSSFTHSLASKFKKKKTNTKIPWTKHWHTQTHLRTHTYTSNHMYINTVTLNTQL